MRIAIHVFDDMTMFHLAAPLLVFGEVTRLGLAQGWEVVTWSMDGRAVRTTEGVVLDDLAGPESVEDADLLVFPAWPAELPVPDPQLLGLVRDVHERGGGVAGLCLGAYPVVGSGVLDGRTVVTHWGGADELALRYPAVQVRSSDLYIDHGDVITSAGTASSLDACLHIVRMRLGATAAAAVARHIVVAPHREGDQAQYIQRPLPENGDGGAIGETIEWALAHLDANLSVEELARRACMSRRSFARRFVEVTGTSPGRWVLSRRLDHARMLLETTTWPIEAIATECGFGSVVTFRQNFVRAFSTTPTSYRSRFGGADAEVARSGVGGRVGAAGGGRDGGLHTGSAGPSGTKANADHPDFGDRRGRGNDH
ncbi:GlxA family transcriptional regulator [Dietzia sp. NPDC055340]|uniref:GlxA family transcriptional regulator n=1 Tax=Arthrobacter koreensis TaxID=199136 RepID=UPI003672F11E